MENPSDLAAFELGFKQDLFQIIPPVYGHITCLCKYNCLVYFSKDENVLYIIFLAKHVTVSVLKFYFGFTLN